MDVNPVRASCFVKVRPTFPRSATVTHLEFARREHGWTIHELAKFTRIHNSFISLVENGKGIPDAGQLGRLSRALDVPPDLLLKPVVVPMELAR